MVAYRVSSLLPIICAVVINCGTALAQSQNLGPISEETPPAVCWAGWFVSGIRCSGRYCDNIEITCTKIPGATVGSDNRWTPWTSEENSSPAWCGPGPNLIAGFACNGRYCDNVSLYCVPLVNLRSIRCWQTRAVSEEHGGSLSFQQGTSGGIVIATQMSCSGSYCDNKTFQLCEIKSP